MKKTLLLYWAPGGNVEEVAKLIRDAIGSEKVEFCDVASFDLSRIDDFENFIIGNSTIGADVWMDASNDNKWNEFFVKTENVNLSGKKVAAFGLGNQILYPENFVDSLGYLKNEVEKRGGHLVGKWPVEGYEFTDSMGAENGYFFGLALDHDNEYDLTEKRVKAWVELLKKEMSF
ncbi:MAG: flavodoxin [Bacteroidales bacterium]|nr:flavodoxin [Bacteroidales bacterium]